MQEGRQRTMKPNEATGLYFESQFIAAGNQWSCFHGNGGRRHQNEMEWILKYKEAIPDSVSQYSLL